MLYPSFQSLSLLQAAPSTRQRIQPSAPGEINFGLLSCCVPSSFCSTLFLSFFFPIFIKRNLGCLLRCCELCIRWRAISKLPCHFRDYVVHAADGRHPPPPPPPCTLSAAYRRVYTGGSCLFVASHRVLPPFAPLT